jgi:polar amino acid transport system substrate-binding protein
MRERLSFPALVRDTPFLPALENAAWNSSAKELVIPAQAVQAGTLCSEAFSLLIENPSWPALCVIDGEGRILGLLSRRTCLSILAKPLMLDLYSRRGIDRIMYPSPLVVDVEESVDHISKRIVDECPEALIDGFVITEEGRYLGVATAQELLVRSVEQARRRSRALEEARKAAEQANLAKSSFLANLSHEIRTPLNGLLANLELLTLTPISSEQRELAGAASVAANALFEIIGEVLDLSKIEAGKLTIETIPMVPAQIIHDLSILIAPQVERSGLVYHCHIDSGAAATVSGDPTRLRQIAMNLLGNAIKFTKNGGIFVSLFDLGRTNGTAEYWLEVADTGVGFSPGKTETLFDAFTQEDSTTTRKFGGTGLGLSICRKLVDLMGGRIHADGEQGQGATFWCRIPFPLVLETEVVPADLTGLDLLLLCHNDKERKRLSKLLTSSGAKLTCAERMKEVIRLVRQRIEEEKPFDAVLVVMDSAHPALLEAATFFAELAEKAVMLTPLEEITLRRTGYRHGYRYSALTDGSAAGLFRCIATACDSLAAETQYALETVNIKRLLDQLAPLQGARLLIIEDNLMNQKVTQRQLATLGFSCEIAENGQIGLERAMTVGDGYDLIFCDIQMPEMDGYTFTRLLRRWENDGQRRHCPVVAMTANALDDDARKCLDNGMDDYVSKPVKIERIAEVLKHWLTAMPKDPEQAKQTPPIDLGQLSLLLGESSLQAHREVLEIFIDCFPPLAEALRLSVAAANRDDIRRTAHTAKGAARNGTAIALSKLLETIEHSAPDADIETLQTLAEQALAEYGRVESFVASLAGRA